MVSEVDKQPPLASSNERYTETKRCCTICDRQKVCHVCGAQTLLACSDCRINLGATVYVCGQRSCREAHDRVCSGERTRTSPVETTPDGPGTPLYRLSWLLRQLEARFPDVHQLFMSDPAEPKYMAAIDALLGRSAQKAKPDDCDHMFRTVGMLEECIHCRRTRRDIRASENGSAST